MDKYQLGLYEKAMPNFAEWGKKLELTRTSGFDWLEISIDETDEKLSRLAWTQAQRNALKNEIMHSGVPIKTMCLSGHRKYSMGSHDANVRKQSLDIMQRALELAAEIGIRVIQIAGYDVYYETSDATTATAFTEGLARATEMAAIYGVTMGFETMETPFMDTVEKAMQSVRQANSPYLGVYPDIGNLKNAAIIYGNDVVSDIKTGEGHILAAHLKETAPSVYRGMMFGTTGHTEYERCISELWRQGVRQYVGEFWFNGEENYTENLKSASRFLREKIEKVKIGER